MYIFQLIFPNPIGMINVQMRLINLSSPTTRSDLKLTRMHLVQKKRIRLRWLELYTSSPLASRDIKVGSKRLSKTLGEET